LSVLSRDGTRVCSLSFLLFLPAEEYVYISYSSSRLTQCAVFIGILNACHTQFHFVEAVFNWSEGVSQSFKSETDRFFDNVSFKNSYTVEFLCSVLSKILVKRRVVLIKFTESRTMMPCNFANKFRACQNAN